MHAGEPRSPAAHHEAYAGRGLAWDLVLMLVCLAVTVTVQVGAIDSVPANRPPDALSVLLTVASVVPLGWRRRRPLAVLGACFPGPLLLMARDYSVGASVVGVLIAFYSVAAWDTRRNARLGLGVLLIGLSLTAVLRPRDLSLEGAVVNIAVLVGGWVIGAATRERRDRYAADVQHAEARARAEWDRAEAERERAARAVAEERLRITRELHDVLGHALSVMVVQAGVADHLVDTRPAAARQAIAEIRSTGRSSLAEMRSMLAVLRSGDPERVARLDPAPTLGQLPDLAVRMRNVGLAVDLTTTGERSDLTAGVQVAIYRIVQEALTNCLKHARATVVRVRVDLLPDTVEVEVVDDGRPSANGVTRSDGHGLAGMRERVEMYGGELVVGPTAAGGFRVLARIPAPAQVAGGCGVPR